MEDVSDVSVSQSDVSRSLFHSYRNMKKILAALTYIISFEVQMLIEISQTSV